MQIMVSLGLTEDAPNCYKNKASLFYSLVFLLLKGVICKILQKPYICGRGGYNSWSDGAHHVDTLGPTKPQGHTMNSKL